MAWERKGLWQWSVSGNTALPIAFTGLADALDIAVIVNAVSLSTSQSMMVQVSTDNGATWYNTSGNYIYMNNTGGKTNYNGFDVNSTTATAARSGSVMIIGTSVNGTPKCDGKSQSGTRYRFVASTSPINAVRVATKSGSAANATAGSIYCMARMP